jgi:hypothetical protein
MSDPAKWQVRPEGDGDWEVIQPIPNTEGHYVCIAYGLTEEHARLIAAAGDMLGTLKIALGAVDHESKDRPMGTRTLVALLKATISKAQVSPAPHRRES